ncbi:MAG: hypothetical protein QXO75_05265 [Nitrososphaerota archaeon]
MFRIKYEGEYLCGKRYPLKCMPGVCPFGELWKVLVRSDFKSDFYWLMPGRHLVGLNEAIDALRNSHAEYVVKSFNIGVSHGKRKHR